MSLLKHRIAFPTILIVLGIALLTTGSIGLVRSYLDLHAPAPSFPSPMGGGEEERVITATPSATPIPPTATSTPTAVPTTPTATVSSTPDTISPIPTATSSPASTLTLRLVSKATSVQASTPTATPAPTVTPSPTFTPTPPGPPPAIAPPDRIVIPNIGLDAQVVPVGWTVTDEGAAWDSADHAAGWHLGSAYPGHVGNTVLSGHHNIEGKVFRYLIDLEPDDEVSLYVGDTAYRYVVTEKHLFEEKGKPEAVRRANAQWIAPSDDERVTLVTCWPYTSNTHRLIIVAKRLDIGEGVQ